MTVQKAAVAGAWSAAETLLRQGVGFVVSIILARLLTPEDFGIVALLSFFISLSIVFVQGGLTAALIQQQETSAEEESTVFWFNLLASIGFAAILIVVAPLIADFYGHPILVPLMLTAAASVVLSALGAVQSALLTRSLRFDQLTKAGVASSLISGALGVGAALLGAGVWALAIQAVTAATSHTVALWLISDWRPMLCFRPRALRRLFSFGVNVGVANLSDVIYTQGFALILGRLHGVRDLGLYNRAHTTQLFASGIFTAIIGRLALPLFAERAADTDALRRGVRMAINLAMLLNMPVMIGLALTADLIVPMLFGAKWTAAVPILSILAVGGVLLPLHFINLQLLLARGRSGIFLAVEVSKKTVGIVCVIVGSSFGVEGLACSQVVFSLLALLFNCHFTKKIISYGFVDQIKDLLGTVIATTFMAVAVLIARELVYTDAMLELAVSVLVGISSYTTLGLLFRISSFYTGLDVLRITLRRRRVDHQTC